MSSRPRTSSQTPPLILSIPKWGGGAQAVARVTARKLPIVAPTRWNFTSRITKTVFKHRTQLIEFFESILDNSDCWDSDTLLKLEGFFRFLHKFETIWLLKVFSKLFTYTDVLYNVLQSKMYDVLYCANKIEEFLRDLQHERGHRFDKIWSSAVECGDNALVSANANGEIAMKATRKLIALPYFLPFKCQSRSKLGMRLFQYLTLSNYFGQPNMVNIKQNFQKIC